MQLLVLVQMLLLLTVLALAVSSLAQELADDGETQLPSLNKGANCLFIGHSYFIPVAIAFGRIASNSDGFAWHDIDYVIATSSSGDGSPRSQWNNPSEKAKVEEKLASSQIELFGMPSVSLEGRVEDFEDYKNWIDLVLSFHANTTIFIGAPKTVSRSVVS